MQQVQAGGRTDSDWQSSAAQNMFMFPFFAQPGIQRVEASSWSCLSPPVAGEAPVMQTLALEREWPIQHFPPATFGPVLPAHGEPALTVRTSPERLIAAVRRADFPVIAEHLADPAVRAAIDTEDDSGRSALDHALENKAFRLARVLVQHGARIADEELLDQQLLVDLINADELAFARDVARARQRLMASQNAPPPDNELALQPALTMAILIGDVELVSLLLSPLSFTLRDNMGNTLLHFGVAAANPRMLPSLLAHLPADQLQRQSMLDAKRVDGRTPLLQAVVSNRPTAAGVLLRAGATIDAVDRKAETAMHKAARDGLLEIGRLLLALGARTDMLNWHGQTPMALARDHGRPDFVQLLEAFDAQE